MSILFDTAGAPVSVRVDVLGYFDGQPSNAGYTPKVSRIFNSQVAPDAPIPTGTTIDVQVNGVGGIPAWSTSMSGWR